MTNPDELQYGREPAAPTNGIATASAVTGLFVCLPGTGLIGIPLAVVGLRRAPRRAGAGKSAAMLGLVLGLINLFWWSAILAGAVQTHRAMKTNEPIIRDTGQFVLFVGKGDLDQAKAFCKPEVTDEQLETLQEQLGMAGQMRQPNPYFGGDGRKRNDVQIQCELTFDTGKRVLIAHWDATSEKPKLFKFQLMDAAATQPATLPAR